MTKKTSLLVAVFCLLIPMLLTAQSPSEFKPRKTFGMKVEEGSLLPLKSTDVNADVYFDYTDCIVNDKTTLDGADSAGDEIIAEINNNLKTAEGAFFNTFKDNWSDKHCQLIPEGNESPYRIEVKVYQLRLWEQKVIMKKSRFTIMHGLIFVYDNKTSEKIATCKFCARGNINKIGNDPEFDYLTQLMYGNLAIDFAKQIKKSKAPKTKK